MIFNPELVNTLLGGRFKSSHNHFHHHSYKGGGSNRPSGGGQANFQTTNVDKIPTRTGFRKHLSIQAKLNNQHELSAKPPNSPELTEKLLSAGLISNFSSRPNTVTGNKNTTVTTVVAHIVQESKQNVEVKNDGTKSDVKNTNLEQKVQDVSLYCRT